MLLAATAAKAGDKGWWCLRSRVFRVSGLSGLGVYDLVVRGGLVLPRLGRFSVLRVQGLELMLSRLLAE